MTQKNCIWINIGNKISYPMFEILCRLVTYSYPQIFRDKEFKFCPYCAREIEVNV